MITIGVGELFEHIPKNVYIIFAVLIYMSYKRCFARTIQIWRLSVVPLLFLVLSLHGMFDLFHIGVIEIFIWLFGCAVGSSLGFLQVRKREIRADRAHKLISVPGDFLSAALILAIFVYEFFIHYSIATGVTFTQLMWFRYLAVFILGAVAGMTIGRNGAYFYKYISLTN